MTIYLVIVTYSNGFPPDIEVFECPVDAAQRLKKDQDVYGQLEGVSVELRKSTLQLGYSAVQS